MSFNNNNKLICIDSFQPLCSLLDNLLEKYLSENDFKYLSQELDINALDLLKQKGFYPYQQIRGFEKFKEELPSKKKFYIP